MNHLAAGLASRLCQRRIPMYHAHCGRPAAIHYLARLRCAHVQMLRSRAAALLAKHVTHTVQVARSMGGVRANTDVRLEQLHLEPD